MIRVSLDNAEVAFSDRTGGSSMPPYDSLNVGRLTDDDQAAVEANIAKLREQLGVNQLQLLRQVHGDAVLDVAVVDDSMPEADAASTAKTGVGLLATGADCPPVALAGATRIAIVHGGWRPVAAGLIEKTAARMGGPFEAVIGPGICQKHFEVGPEVVEALGQGAVARTDGRQLDLRGVIADRLSAAGALNVTDVDRCTFCEPDAFFSHRRDGGVTGRQAGVIWRT